MSIIRKHPVSTALWCIGIPLWIAFALAGFEALLIVVLLEALVIVLKGLWQ